MRRSDRDNREDGPQTHVRTCANDEQSCRAGTVSDLDNAFSALAAAIVRDLPSEAVAVELAEPGCYSATAALAYIEGHNSAALGRRDHRWAVAVPVTLAYEGDPAR